MPATIHLELWYTYLRWRGREEKSETDTEREERPRKPVETGAGRDREMKRWKIVGIKQRIQQRKGVGYRTRDNQIEMKMEKEVGWGRAAKGCG